MAGTWKTEPERNFSTEDVARASKSNPYANLHFRVGTNVWAPFVIKSGSGSNSTYSGVYMELLQYMAERMNFTYTLREPVDGQWGNKANVTWTGLVGMIAQNESDLIMAPLANHLSRHEVMDFIEHPLHILSKTILLKMPLPQNEDILHKPFKATTWLFIVSCFFALSLFNWLLVRLNRREMEENNSTRSANAIWHTTRVFLMQSCTGQEIKRGQGSRLVTVASWYFMVIVASIYSGNLVAFLAAPKVALPFHNLEELVQQSDYKFGYLGGTVQEHMFRDSRLVLFKRMWNKIENFKKTDPTVTSFDHGELMHKVRSEKFAYILDTLSVAREIAQDCSLVRIKQTFYGPTSYSIGTSKSFPYRDTLNKVMADANSFGLVQHWLMKYTRRASPCLAGNHPSRVELGHVLCLFYVLSISILFAFLSLTIECVQGKLASTRDMWIIFCLLNLGQCHNPQFIS